MGLSSPLGESYGFQETEEFLAQVEAIVGSVRRWDEVKSGLDFALGRDPRIGLEIPGTRLRAMPLVTQPAITVYYTVDDESRLVIMIEAHFV